MVIFVTSFWLACNVNELDEIIGLILLQTEYV
jgi:hypothetical protein